MININDKINLNLNLKLTIIKKIYYSVQTKRGFYKVYNEYMGNYYGMKVLDLECNEIDDINKEIISYNRVQNKLTNFPKIHYSFEKDNVFYLLMDWVDGENISDFFKRVPRDKFEIKNRLSYCIEICKSVDLIHRSNLIHRDLKPENILITNKKNHNNSISIIDYGLSALKRNIDGEGTPLYQSPEQELGDFTISVKSDIYSLGQVIHYILHTKPMELYPNDDYDDWNSFELYSIENIDYNTEDYKKIFTQTLAYNPKNRCNINQLINNLKQFSKGVK